MSPKRRLTVETEGASRSALLLASFPSAKNPAGQHGRRDFSVTSCAEGDVFDHIANPTQPTLFELREDARPMTQRSATGRYLEPSLLDMMGKRLGSGAPRARSGRGRMRDNANLDQNPD